METDLAILKLSSELDLLIYEHDRESRKMLGLPLAEYVINTHFLVDKDGYYYDVNPKHGLLSFLKNFDKYKIKQRIKW